MKLVTKEEEQEHYNYILENGLKGGALGLGIGLGLSLVTQKFSSSYRSLTLPLKTFLVTSVSTAVFIVAAEKASLKYEKLKYPEHQLIHSHQNVEVKQNLTIDKAKRFFSDHRWSIVGGSWVLALGGSMGALYKNKYLTTAQKFVQARMYAQGLTLIILLASAGLSTSGRKEPAGFQDWKDMVIEEERALNKVPPSKQ